MIAARMTDSDAAHYSHIRANATRLDELLAKALYIAAGHYPTRERQYAPLYLIQAYTIRRLPDLQSSIREIFDASA